MLPIRRILLPIDFSDRAKPAVYLAQLIAKRFGSEITLLHVIPPPDFSLGAAELAAVAMDKWYADRRAAAHKALAEFLIEEAPDLQVKRLLAEGDPAAKIVEVAHNEQFSMILMPTHGYGPFRRFILGSVTAKVLHDADCPVLTSVHIEEEAKRPLDVKHVMCALDFTETAAKTLEYAGQVAAEFGAALTIVHALPPLEAGEARYFDQSWRMALRKGAEESIAELKAQVGIETAETVIESGDPAKVVDSIARKRKADLMVIGRATEKGILGRIRANAYAIIRQSPCPVVSV